MVKKIDKKICDLLEQLHYETNAYADLIAFLSKNDIDINQDNYKYLKEEYIQKNIEYQFAKKEMQKINHLPLNCEWILDFDTCEVTYEE